MTSILSRWLDLSHPLGFRLDAGPSPVTLRRLTAALASLAPTQLEVPPDWAPGSSDEAGEGAAAIHYITERGEVCTKRRGRERAVKLHRRARRGRCAEWRGTRARRSETRYGTPMCVYA